MKKKLIYSTLLILLIFFIGCASEPETPEPIPEETPVEEPVIQEEPAEEPVAEEPQAEEPVVEAPEPVSDEEIFEAQNAIEKAEFVGAPTYAPELFLLANENLDEAISNAEQNPDQSRILLASAVKNAEEAYEQALDAQVEIKVAKLRGLESQLKDMEAEKFTSDEYNIVKDRADKLIEYLNNEDYEQADRQYHSTLRALQNLHDTLDTNIRWIKILDRDTTAYISEAEEEEAFLWAPEELEKANYRYSEGISHYNNYDLEASEAALKEAKYWAFQSTRLSEERKRRSQTDTLMLEALEELEAASRNRVIDDSGTITEADPWDGDEFIDNNPAPGEKVEDFTEEDSSLKEYDPDAEIEENDGALIIDGTTEVLGDEQQMTLLEQAIELWKQGVKARSDGKYEIADEYFKQSKAYSEAYSANAVAREYIVKKHDTLWAISSKEDVMDNPFLWTKIWRRNSRTIENPDLIYPGQKLIIPPK